MFTNIATLLFLVAYVFGQGQVLPFITSTTMYPAANAYASEADPNNPICKLNIYGPPLFSSVLTSRAAHTWAIYQT